MFFQNKIELFYEIHEKVSKLRTLDRPYNFVQEFILVLLKDLSISIVWNKSCALEIYRAWWAKTKWSMWTFSDENESADANLFMCWFTQNTEMQRRKIMIFGEKKSENAAKIARKE